MAAKVGTISGTWGRSGAGSYGWWRPPSVFIANLQSAGLEIVSDVDYFDWSTNLDGVKGHNDDWETSGKALYWWWQSHGSPPLSLIGHSHAAQVIAYALAYGVRLGDPLTLQHLVTVASPVREDINGLWAIGRPYVRDWTHLYCDEVERAPDDLGYQEIGSRPHTAAFPFTREMSHANRNIRILPATTHHGMMWSKLWLDRDLFQYLKP